MKRGHLTSARLYRLYVKWPGQKKFAPVDWSTGETVGALMHATLFTIEEVGRVAADIESHNKGRFEYKFVKVKMQDDDDDSQVRGNPPSSAGACETFHGDGACEDFTEARLWMPGPIALMGDCIDCGYDVTNRRSEKDGRYVHDHKDGVKLYRRADDNERPSKTLSPPRQVFVLGNWLGCTYDDRAGKQELMGSSRIKACTDNGRRLFAIHSTKGCLYVISGGRFHIRDWMYD